MPTVRTRAEQLRELERIILADYITTHPTAARNYRDRHGYRRPTCFKFSKSRTDRELRAAIYTRDNFTCRHCGYRPDTIPDPYDGWNTIGQLVLDHVIPLWAGGPARTPTNLQTLCAPCNGRKG